MFERSAATRLASVTSQFRRAFGSVADYLLTHRFQANGLAIIAASAFLVRFLTLLGNPAPPGADYGNYLTNLHAAEGMDVTGGGVQYPGVFIAYLWVVVSAFGELQGLLISGPLLAALVCIPSYILLRNFGTPVFAMLGSAVLTFGEWASEMIGWGGNPNLLGILFGVCFMAFLAEYLRSGTRRELILGAVFLALTAGSHQISVVVFAVSALFAIFIAGAVTRDRHVMKRGARVLLAGVACSLPFIPFYLGFAGGFSGAPVFDPTPITVKDMVFIFDWFFRESLVLWIPLVAAAVVGYRRLLRSNPVSFAVGISLLAAPLLLMETLMSQHPVRSVYFLPLGIVPGAVAYVQSTAEQLRSRAESPSPTSAARSVLLAVILTAALVLVSTSQTRMAQAEAFYTVATPELLDILHWVDAYTPRMSVIATSGPSQYGQEANVGCQWGWWIEGVGERESLCTADLQYLAWQTQIDRSAEANRVFAGVVSFENGWVRMGDFAPYGTRGNPIVSGDFGLGYETLVYFDDASVTVRWNDSTTGILRSASAHDLSAATNTASSNGSAAFRSVDVGQGISVVRTVTMSAGSALIWNNYSFKVAGTLSQVSVSVFGTSHSRLNDFDQRRMALAVGSAPGFREDAAGEVRIQDGAQDFVDASYSTNPESSMPQVGLVFDPTGGTFNLSLAIEAFVDHSVPVSGVQIHTAKQVLAAAGAGYVLVDKTRLRDYEWLAADRADFRVAYQNSRIGLFSVV